MRLGGPGHRQPLGDDRADGAALDVADDLLIRLAMIILSVVFLTALYRSRMELRGGELLLATPSRAVPLDTLVSVTPGRDGLTYETSDGAHYGSPALIGEKAPRSSWIGRHTKVDSMADEIVAARPGS